MNLIERDLCSIRVVFLGWNMKLTSKKLWTWFANLKKYPSTRALRNSFLPSPSSGVISRVNSLQAKQFHSIPWKKKRSFTKFGWGPNIIVIVSLHIIVCERLSVMQCLARLTRFWVRRFCVQKSKNTLFLSSHTRGSKEVGVSCRFNVAGLRHNKLTNLDFQRY